MVPDLAPTHGIQREIPVLQMPALRNVFPVAAGRAGGLTMAEKKQWVRPSYRKVQLFPPIGTLDEFVDDFSPENEG